MTTPARAQNQKLAPIGLRAFFKLADQWDLSANEQIILLGRPSRSSFYNWRAGRISAVPHDSLSRLSHLLAIAQNLQQIFADPHQAFAWLHKPNDVLYGQSALAVMLAGELTDIAMIRHYLEGINLGLEACVAVTPFMGRALEKAKGSKPFA